MFKKLALISILFSLLSACSTQQPIHNVQDSLVPPKHDGTLLTKQEVNQAIVKAATFKRWKASNLDEDTVQAKITVRGRHHATVFIDYSELSYNITLQSSDGLDEKNGKIHRNYNKWIILLDEQIQAELLEASSGG
ncbi:hypothetical protein F0M18_11835 [Pseudohalioglobus sediminis]|uniref:Lipoprotein n=1 Tax=Pseudohalioglobus sediminis TaxID=2606449 RepID=A0A5B0WVT9_9GAMM|nr:hypothetical protein [Pseudohalioglobus sediminis]KAA1190498.1 hypothetical protein F0M18_11835 [Pseudohalioglobus sediminis]